ncbi:MAG TPA: MFS transporter [Acidimicrobiales bacterium]|jgi:EmrB/QacA subfamily drug resistance transporter|nr:MFS transporter [Acidimicrobiales bacterium]
MAMARGWKVLMVTSVAVYLVSLDVTVVNIAFPTILEEFEGTSRTFLSWSLSGYNIGFAAALLTAGRLADRFGRKRIFLIGLTGFSVASMLCGIAPTPGTLIAARVLQALAGALVMPSSLALVLPEFPPNRRSAAIGVWGAVGGIAAATGPSLGSVLVENISWRAVFFINVPLCIATWIFGRPILQESRDENARGMPDVLGSFLGIGAVGMLTLAIVQGDDWGYDDSRVIAALVLAAALLPLFLLRCHRRTDPILDLGLLKERYFTVANLAAFLFSLGFFAMLFTNVQYLVGVWQYSTLGAGLAMTPGPLFAAMTSAPAGRLADRYGHRVVIVPGTAIFAIGMVLLVVGMGPEPQYWTRLFPASVFTGVGVGFTISTVGSAANAFLPPARFAMGSAFNATVRQIGAALGFATAVAILGTADRVGPAAAFDRAWGMMAACSLSAGLLMLVAYRRPLAAPQPDVSAAPGIPAVAAD